jgi:hypothetical protein
MNSDSWRIDSSTATAATSASSRKVGSAGTSRHSACAAKKVANRIETAAAASALAVTG